MKTDSAIARGRVRSRLLPRLTVLAGVALAAVVSGAGQDASFAEVGRTVLPDGRVWEQVSPVAKAGNDVAQGAAMASVNGDRLQFMSWGPFPGVETSLGADGIRYMATRTPDGWRTVSLMPPGGRLSLGGNGYQGFTADLSRGIIAWSEDQITGTLSPEAAYGTKIYMRETESGGFRLLNGPLDPAGGLNGFAWGSSDFSKLAIESPFKLTEDSPCGSVAAGTGEREPPTRCAYEWDNGHLALASVSTEGKPIEGFIGAELGWGSVWHAMSDDGSRLFFTSPPARSGEVPQELYARENGATTTLVSPSERTHPGGASADAVYFQAAEASHGNRVIFTTERSLVDADNNTTADLYLYDFTKPEGHRLTLISEDRDPEAPEGAEVSIWGYAFGNIPSGGVMATSDDLHRVYFVAKNQIVPGGPTAPGPKLYLWDDTGSSPEVTYIATLSDPNERVYDIGGPFDGFDWSGPTTKWREFIRPVRWSADGRYMAFLSWAQLTSFPTEGRQEVYLYDAVKRSLVCASCSADRFPAETQEPKLGEISFVESLYTTIPMNHLSVNVTESGQVFFQTVRGLVPQDSNGMMDVYEYENGVLHLISAGTGDANSYFLDATPNGSDVFFTTRDRLVGWDVDQSADVYDARVNGGLPEPPPSPPPCEGDACQPPPVVPGDPSLASIGFHGEGNVQPEAQRRKKHKAHRRGKRHKGHHAHKHRNQKHLRGSGRAGG